MDEHSVFLLLCSVIDKVVDGGANLVFVTRAFVCWNIVYVPIDEAANFAAFAFVVFSLALAVFAFSLFVVSFAFSFWVSGLPGVVCITATRFDKVVGELCEVTYEDVIVVDLPGGDEGVELRLPLYRFFECLDLGGV